MEDDSAPDGDFAATSAAAEGVRISTDGYYTCEDCDETLEATGEVEVVDGRKHGVFRCSECGKEYPC